MIRRQMKFMIKFVQLSLVVSTHSLCLFEDGVLLPSGIITASALSDCQTDTSDIHLMGKGIISIDNGTFDDFWQVQSLNLTRNELTFLPPTLFHFLRDLQTLDLSYNKLSELHDGLFGDKSKLEFVDLSHNKIKTIGLNVFTKDLMSLLFIDLSYNLLTSIEPWPYVLPADDNRAKVHLEHNQISSFTNYMNFTVDHRQPIRQGVFLNFNNFTEWDDKLLLQFSDTYSNVFVEYLRYRMNFSDNPWSCDCRLYNIVHLLRQSVLRYRDIDDYRWQCTLPPHLYGGDPLHDISLGSFICNITEECPDDCVCIEMSVESFVMVDCSNSGLEALPPTLPSIRFKRFNLNLRNNSISEITNVSYIGDIVHLNVADNDISYIDGNVLESMESIETLDLRNNNLHAVPISIQKLFLKDVFLDGNPLACNCDMLWMNEWIRLSNKAEFELLHCKYYDDAEYKIIDVTYDLLDCGDKKLFTLGIVAGAVLVVVIVLVITAHRCPYETKVILYKLFRIHPRDKYKVDYTGNKLHDAYIVFDDLDIHVRQWTMNTFRRKLEDKKNPYNIFVPYRDLLAGNYKADEITTQINNAKRIFIILSERLNDNEWRLFECNQAELLVPENKNTVYILYDEKGEILSRDEPWKFRISEKTLLHREERLFWSKLKYELPLNR